MVRQLIDRRFDAAALRKGFRVFIDNHFDGWGKFGIPLELNHVFRSNVFVVRTFFTGFIVSVGMLC